MKKRLSLVLSVISSVFILFSAVSCAGESSDGGSESHADGKISGTVKFSNVDSSSNGGIVVTLDRTDGLRSVAVVNAVASRSIAGAARSVVGTTLTKSDGSYLFDNLEPGTYTVYAASSYSSERAVCTNVVVRSAETAIADALKLTATGTITGTITLDGTKNGNTGFLVFVAGTSYMAMTDDSGNYKISGVPAGSGYLVVATKNGVIHSISSNVTVKANGSSQMADNNFTSAELESGVKGDKGDPGESIVWKGSFAAASEISNPKKLDAYFNTTYGCSYIYTGTEWTLLAKAGANGAGSTSGGTSTVDTAPGVVKNLLAKYNRSTKVITVTWTKPGDSDLDYVSLSYTKDGTSVVSDSHQSGTSYSISDVEIDGKEYVFTLYAVDKAGNEGTSTTTSVTPTEGVCVQSISLSRYHLAYNDTDQTVVATATLSNADLIEDGTVIKIQIKDSSGNVTNTVATLDAAAGTATATITAPVTSAITYATYTVLCKIGDEAADATHTARFNVSEAASLYYSSDAIKISSDGTTYTGKVQIALSSVTSSTKVSVRIKGDNLDLTTPTIQLYDSTGAAYFEEPIAVDTSAVAWTATSGENSQTIDTQVSVPTVEDSYSVRVLFGTAAQKNSYGYYSGTLQVYDVPKFTSFTIPLVSTTKEDNLVTAKITGKNFDTPDTDLGNFTASCSTGSITADASFTKDSDSVLYASFKIPGTAGDYSITVSYGSNSKTATLKVQDFSAYKVGDVLLNDGTIVRYAANQTFTDTQKSSAVGVMYAFSEYGAPAGWLGLHNSDDGTNSDYYMWAKEDTTGYNTEFTDIICTPSRTGSGTAKTATFTGDTDGSDNWAYICSIDPEGTANAAENYPAFDYVNNYASTFGLTAPYTAGWYMPSISELCYIYRNKTTVNAVLEALGGTQMASKSYWSSSQDDSTNYDAWRLHFSYGDLYDNDKDSDYRVCCVRAFNN